MSDTQYPQIRITPSDYDWLKARAESHHRTMIGELSAIRDVVTIFEQSGKVDVLPHPDGAQVVPVMKS